MRSAKNKEKILKEAFRYYISYHYPCRSIMFFFVCLFPFSICLAGPFFTLLVAPIPLLVSHGSGGPSATRRDAATGNWEGDSIRLDINLMGFLSNLPGQRRNQSIKKVYEIREKESSTYTHTDIETHSESVAVGPGY